MNGKINNLISKTEVQFWLGFIVLLISATAGFFNLSNKLDLLCQRVDMLTQRIEEVNSKFSAIHTDNADQEIRISKLEFVVFSNRN